MKKLICVFLTLVTFSLSFAQDLKLGDPAPLFKIKNHRGDEFDLSTRKDKWTVLFFYPKAGTPGCTKQACAFRDNIKKIRDLGAEVFGISSDSVEAQAKFHDEHKMSFDLLSDDQSKVISLYGSKMPVVNFSKRWTFIVGPDLKIASIDKDVDPILDAKKVSEKILELQKTKR